MTLTFNAPKKVVIKNYLEQQIYSGNDIITDRTNTVKLKVPGSGNVINNMANVFCSYAEKILFGETNSEKKYVEFIKRLANDLGFEEQIAINLFSKRYSEMQKGKIFDTSLFFLTAVSVIIESFQEKVIKRLNLKLKRKIPFMKENMVQESLERLVQTSNKTFSLLINIEILKEMSRLLGEQIEVPIIDDYQQEIISLLTNK